MTRIREFLRTYRAYRIFGRITAARHAWFLSGIK